MKPIQDWLAELETADIHIWLEGGEQEDPPRLRCNAPKGVLTPELKARLSARKTEAIAYLQALDGKIQPQSRPERIPLSFAQQRLWFLDRLESGTSTDYNLFSPWQIDGPLDESALEKALQEIRRRHEILRTNFCEIDGEVQQVIQPEAGWFLPLVDLQHLTASERAAEVRQRRQQEEIKPFDLARDALMRGCLLKLSPQSHILLLTFHHIVFDGWSNGVFLRECSALYRAFRDGKPSSLPPLSIQYADYALWQRQWLQGAELDRQLKYWQQQFASLPPPLELPCICAQPPEETARGGQHTFEIVPELTRALRQLGRTVGATLFMTVLTAYAILLYRYSDREDLTIGIPTASRNRKEIEPLLGFFVNTLALRFNLTGNPSFRTLVGQVRRQVLAAQDHQDLPFEKLVEVLQPERDRSHSPLFRVMFVLQRQTMGATQIDDLNITPMPGTQATETFDLTLFLTETEQELRGIWEYDRHRFDREAIERLTGHLQTLLRGIVASPEETIGHLPLLTGREEQQILSWGMGEAEPALDPPSVLTLFNARAIDHPEAIAVEWEDEKLTYRELYQQSKGLARVLQNRGATSETLVGLCVRRSPEAIVGMLAILQAGAAYVPIDPDAPEERIAGIVAETRIQLILSQTKLAAKLTGLNADCLFLDTEEAILDSPSLDFPDSPIAGHHLAYVIYTSGSTGRPKGVAVEHRSLGSFVRSAIATYGINRRDRVLQFAALSFDTAIEEIYPCLCAGATLVLREGEEIPTSEEFWQQCRDRRLTVLDLPTAYWHVLAADLREDSFLPPTLRWVAIGGERALPAPWRQWQEWLSAKTKQDPHRHPVETLNTYGPTETTVVATFYRASPSSPTDRVPIGRPLGEARVYLLDSRQQLVPVGIAGELYIGGPGVARGYLNQPELTTEGFIIWHGRRLYKTGDRARYLADGNLEYLGRIDNQVKLRGFRIELGEIEAALVEHPDIREAAVRLMGNPPQQRLAAYMVSPSPTLSHGRLQQFLQQKLPDYMIPTVWIPVDRLPRSLNGKIDRSALPVPVDNGESDRDRMLPRNRWELGLAQIWSEVLQVQAIGMKDNFFDVGGHSLLGVSLMSKIRQTFGRSLPLATLFQEGTIERQALLLRQDSPIPWSPLVPLRATGNQPPLFCVHPGGGSAFAYVRLADGLHRDRPVYGIDPRGFEGGELPHDRIETMATYYIETLQGFYQGPYYLVGWCFGGLVAFEIARQLHQRGQRVAFLGLLDMPDYYNLTEHQFPQFNEKVEQFIVLFDKHLTHCHNVLPLLSPEERFPYVLEEAKRLELIPMTFGMPEALNLIDVAEAHKRAIENYVFSLPPYPGKATLIQARDGITSTVGRSTQGWSQLIKTVEVHWIPGNHFSILGASGVKTLAETLQRCLEDSDR
ncbi:MAG: amino acid adenylation domain-containing protein [Cyanobacteria bacterium SBLK]|nr:amino acid adenylation domain-containing protein [Cyanobacteria bacterium SBLK]